MIWGVFWDNKKLVLKKKKERKENHKMLFPINETFWKVGNFALLKKPPLTRKKITLQLRRNKVLNEKKGLLIHRSQMQSKIPYSISFSNNIG